MESPVQLELPDSDIRYFAKIYTADKAKRIQNTLLVETPWRAEKITVFGKTYDQPRLTAWYGEEGKSYSYSNIVMDPIPFTPLLSEIKAKIESLTGAAFNSCLLNLYRDGQDSNGWHADDEKELGRNPVIASLSFGQSRMFHLRHKMDKSMKKKIELTSGSLLLMRGVTQHYWQHQVPKTKRKIDPRINLTFRFIQ